MTTLLEAFVCDGNLDFKVGYPFNIGNDDYNFLGQPDPDFVIARPFLNTELGEDNAELVSK